MNSLIDDKPLISVLVPVFNVGHYLASCLDSLLDSSYQRIEIIAIDDFSRDDSWKILKTYKAFDKRIRIYRNIKHYGKTVTFNRLIRKAKGQYTVFMDGKDMVYKNKFKKQMTFLSENEKVIAVGTQCTFINSQGKKIDVSRFPMENETILAQPLHAVSFDFETIMINRALLPKDALYFNPNAGLLYSDIMLKLSQFGEIANLPQLLQYRRIENPHRQTTFTKIPSLIKLWLTSMDSYDYKPPLYSFFSSLFRNSSLSSQ